MCLSKIFFFKTSDPLLNNSRVFHFLHHSIFSKFSRSRHHILTKNISQLSFTNTLVVPSHSVFIDSPATAHIKKFVCWIDRKTFSVLSCAPLKKQILKQKLICTTKYRKDIKMVWISNLDNPKVKYSELISW